MTTKIHEAITYAGKRHAGQVRKGSNIPYLVHPMEVMGILIENGCSEEVVIAGILHDVIEDTCDDNNIIRDIVRNEIKEKFGSKVLEIVNGTSEEKSKTWKERKQHTIDSLPETSKEIQMVCCADKLSNLLSTKENLQNIGDKVWKRFNAGREDLKWYHKGVAENLTKISEMKMFEDLKQAVIEVFGK
ncbi:MAG: HD domain-containing protein [Treponema sp.]|nr:HD domain-containing protein [Treponema sp.]